MQTAPSRRRLWRTVLPPGGGLVNQGEAALLMRLVDGLLAAGVSGGDIGLASP